MNKWMSREEAFRILGIGRTDDKREIKKAYARLVKQYHPEEYPKEWEIIHDAYETACRSVDLEKAAQKDECYDVKKSIELTAQSKAMPEEKMPGKREPSEEKLPGKRKASEEKIPGKQEPSEEEIPGKREPSEEKLPRKWKRSEKSIAESMEAIREKMAPTGEKSPEEEIRKLFQEVEQLSKEQLRQNEEERRKALAKVLERWKSISAKRKIDQKEWESFFWDEEILPLISTKEFLYSLGDTVSRRSIDKETCLFLSEQIRRIEQYSRENNIVLKNEREDPVGYAKSKVRCAYKAKNTLKDASANFSAIGRTFVCFMIIALVFGGILPSLSSKKEAKQRRQEEQIAKWQEEFLRLKDYEKMNNILDGLEGYESEKIVYIGDTREKLISLYGEPDMIQESIVNEGCEEAIYYRSGGGNLKYILDGDLIVGIRYEGGEEDSHR